MQVVELPIDGGRMKVSTISAAVHDEEHAQSKLGETLDEQVLKTINRRS